MDKKEFQVKMMFYIMAKGFEEIAKVDEEFQEDLEDIDGIVQWNIGNIRAYLKFDEGKYSFEMDKEADDPDVTMILEDIDFARKFFNGEEDGTAAYMSGDLKIEGNLQLTMTYGSLAEYLGDYLKFLRPEE
jgi:putative sterol carrier protein